MRGYYSKDKRKYGEMSYESKYLLDPKYMTKRDLQHYYRYYNMTRNRSQFKKIVVLIFCICFFSYIFVDYNLKTKIIQLRDRFDFTPRMDAEYNITQAYFVDTPGCRMPFFPVTDEDIIQFMSRPMKFRCRKPLTRTADTGATILINMNATEIRETYNISDLSNVNCYYQELKRKSNEENTYFHPVPFGLQSNGIVEVLPGIEFIAIQCTDAGDRVFYKDYHFFALNKSSSSTSKWNRPPTLTKQKEKVKRSEKAKVEYKTRWSTTKTDSASSEAVERVSVMLLGFDSLSHLNFLRQLRRSAAYVHANLSHVELWGYNKVADNTYPNLMPVLTGLEANELNISCLEQSKAGNYDECSFVWKRYKESGYQTAYGEDVSQLSLFNFKNSGFEIQPTDYYLNTIMGAMEEHIGEMQDNNVMLCMGGRRTVDVLLEWIRKLLPYLQQQDFFSFFWTVTLTHDLFNMAQLLDDELVRLLALFEQAGIFNKTVIFLMSDHGLRFGSFRKTYQGMVEDRQPLLIALYPRWFRQKYASAIGNLETNAKRLTTHFDLHATLLDLLDLQNLDEAQLQMRASNIAEADTMPRGISLFLPVPETRTCDNAGIASHWCTCHQREELPTNDARVQRAARYLVKLINDRIRGHPQCRVLYLNSILEAMIAAPHHKIVKDVSNDYSIDITIRIQAKPGLGLFESTVRMSSYAIALTGTISRLNLYNSQSYCIDDHTLKMFCYCHR